MKTKITIMAKGAGATELASLRESFNQFVGAEATEVEDGVRIIVDLPDMEQSITDQLVCWLKESKYGGTMSIAGAFGDCLIHNTAHPSVANIIRGNIATVGSP